jgi:hypothetical protein
MLYRGIILSTLVLASGGGCGGCSSDGFVLDARATDALTLGTVSLAWSITDLDGRPITCEQVGASTVALELRNRNAAGGVAASFSCGNSPSMSQPIATGVYDLSFQLRGPGGTLAAAQDQTGVVISAGQNTVLAPVTFPVDARGSLVLSIAAPPTTSNCRTPQMGGAGITGTTITLVQAGGSCAPVTFIRARGATQIGTYTVSCSSPLQASCVEVDETLTVPSMPSGPYTIHVRGKIAGVDCWKNDDALQVPPQGRALVRTLNLAHQDIPGC